MEAQAILADANKQIENTIRAIKEANAAQGANQAGARESWIIQERG
jgi:hypothetical protein